MRTNRRNRPTSLSRITPLVAALASMFAAHQAMAACTPSSTAPNLVFCVTNTNATGPGSLAQAFLDANNFATCANTTPTIGFAIPGTGPFVIFPSSGFQFGCSGSPPGSMHGVLDGTSQAGYTPNGSSTGFDSNIQIVLDGSLIPVPGATAAIVANDFGYGGSLTVKGIEIRNYSYSYGGAAGIDGPVNVYGSRISNVPTGIAASSIEPDGFLGPLAIGPANIGGPTAAERNVIANTSNAGIFVAYGGSANIVNNFVGTLDGATAGGGGKGIWLESAGAMSIQNNVISGNAGAAGIYISNSGSGVAIQGNKIGTAALGTALPNSGDGIHSVSSFPVYIADNTIAFNGGSGFNIPFGNGNELYGNRIFGNNVKAINLGNVATPVPNDSDGTDNDSGANDLQNFPVISSVIKDQAANTTTINWTLSYLATTGPNDFFIEFFSNPAASASPQATSVLTPGHTETIPSPGSSTFFRTTTISGLHDFITATATDVALGNTSEVGAAPLAKGVALAPTSINFGNVVVGATSASQSATLTSLGSGPAQITQISGTSLCYGGPAPICGSSQFSCTTTCATGTFSGGTSCSFSASFSPIALGPQTTTIYICDDAGGNPARTLTLTGNAVAPPPATVSPTSHDFGAVEVGGQSANQSFTLNNPAPIAITLTPIAVTPPFQIVSNSCTSALSAGASCTAVVKYAPTVVGPSSGTLSTTASSGSVNAALAGTATAAPPATLTPASVDFGAVTVGTASAFATFTLTNPAVTPMPVGTFSVTPAFTLGTVTCTSSLPPGGSCTAQVKFEPVAPGPVSGAINVSAGGATYSAGLAGSGTASPVLALSPAAHDFGSVLLGASSAAKSFLVQNPAPVSSSLSLSTNPPFQIVNTTCGTTIAANGSCTANVTFVPTASGPASGSLVATSSAGSSGASLTGNGVRQPAVSMPTSTIDFGSMIVNSAPVMQTIQLSSTGNTTLGINSISVSPPFTHTTTCGASLAQNDSCNITIGFNPTSIGDFTGFLSVSTNAPGGTFLQAPLRAAVQQRPEPLIQVSPRAINFGARFSGGEASPPQNVTIRNEGGSVATLDITLNVPNFSIVNSRCGATLAPGAQCDFEVGFSPQGYGPKRGDLVVRSNAPNSPQGVSLSGASCRPGTFSPNRGTPPINCSP